MLDFLPIRSLALLSLLLAATATPVTAAPATADDTAKAEELFARRLLPLFKEKCFACHGVDGDGLKGGLDMRSRDALLHGGDSGEPALVSGAGAKSALVRAALREDDEFSPMPPKENDRLTSEQIAWIGQWVDAGAPWPSEEQIAKLTANSEWDKDGGVQVATSGGLAPEWTNRRYLPENLWAYRKLAKPQLPQGLAPAQAIDALIDATIKKLGVAPAPLADRRTLLRRATFDLTGLPPSPDEVAAFLRDTDSDEQAFAKVVDRLLASPHYGEQWGRHWLDVVRYADSSGYANDYERGNAWRYRDYVVRAFNDDKPYDRFMREQVAGDELDPKNPELLVAVGFLRMGPWELTGMEVPRIARQKYLDDVTEAVGQTFLGHQLQCAKCHDHKFDPIPTRDYYRMEAIFATTQLVERRGNAEFLPCENTAGFGERKYLEARRAHYQKILEQLGEREIEAARAWYAEQKADPAVFERALARADRLDGKRADRSARYDTARRLMQADGIDDQQLPPRHAGFTTQEFGLDRVARKGMERLAWELERYEPVALSVYSGRTPTLKAVTAPLRIPNDPLKTGELESSNILAGGDPYSAKDPVTPGVLSAVSYGGAAHDSGKVRTEIAGRRTDLADWLVNHYNNPLPARTMVNRVWQWHFGQAIAGNPNNFGATGKKPTHPELLDWLAATFIDSGWSVKSLHRAIMLSQVYRRACEHPDPAQLAKHDPTGTAYAVFRPRRLEAEELRDAMLAVSGELRLTVGGIPVRPEIHPEVALQPRQVMGTFAPAWQPSPKPEERHRRSLYAQRLRGLPDPQMEVFNQPGCDFSCEARDVSTVTPQVFTLFNSQSTNDRALAFAARLLKETSSREATIERAFRLVFGRAPTDAQRAECLAHWQRMIERQKTLVFEPRQHPREILREAVEENTGEKFTFVEPLELVADFVPDLEPAKADAITRALADVCLVLLNSNEFVYVY